MLRCLDNIGGLQLTRRGTANGILLLHFFFSFFRANMAEQKSSCMHILARQGKLSFCGVHSKNKSWMFYRLPVPRSYVTVLQLTICRYDAL